MFDLVSRLSLQLVKIESQGFRGLNFVIRRSESHKQFKIDRQE
jgi:hypothetical protein